MKYTLAVMIMSLMLFGCGKQDEHAGHDHGEMEMDKEAKMMATQAEQIIYHTCPMDEHKHIHGPEGEACSECGMKLVPAVTTTVEKMEYYGCPMEAHSHVRLDEAGTCEDCGMKLKPMRLKQG